ncbi:MAG TPA: flagellar biosynthetic protein FliO [Alphaproteobacteria bacterium]
MDTYFRFIAALVFVIALIALVGWLARRYGLGAFAMPKGARRKRLSLVDVMPLDGKRRLVLVARDGVEHLILLGSHGDIAIESGIAAEQGSFAATLDGGDGKHSGGVS